MLDFIGIGLGPFNLSLASLLHQKSTLNYLFFEQKQQFDWHAGMQLPQTVLQVPFMADLVSMVDPTSPLSFLNYLKHQHRLYKFYFLEQPHIPRREYNHYCQWAADQIEQIRYQSTVKAIHPIRLGFEVLVEQDGITQRYRCRHLVIGTGNSPRLPNCLDHIKEELPDRCLHSADYIHHRDQDLYGNVVVLGSGQSAAEVFQDLLKRQAKHENLASTFELHWLTRSQGFFPMEYTPLGLEHFSPDYVSSFYQLDENTKQRLIQEQSLLYKGISARTIREIYQQLYHMTVAQKASHTHLHQHCELVDATKHEHDAIRLRFKHRLTRQEFVIDAQSVIAATGYQQVQFDFLKQLDPLIEKNTHGHWKVTEHYQIKHQGHGQIFVQNQEMHSHGVVTPDLGMGAFRAAIIANQLMGYKHYDVQTHECFQHFDLTKNPHITMVPSNLTHEKATDEDKLRIAQTQYHQAKQHFYTSKNYYENTL